MTPEAQRIAIAEVCGFQKWKSKSGKVYLRMVSKHQGDYYRDCGDGLTSDAITQPLTGVPDYLNDLNAMRQALNTLDNSTGRGLIENLCKIRHGWEHNTYFDLFVRSTASQWAEAFLRTIGKWVEE